MVDRLHFTDSDAANELLVQDPLALLIGFALDQQVTVQKAFSGPLVLRERTGTLDAAALAAIDLEPVFRERPAIHRFPGAMAKRVHDLVVHIAAEYGGDAARVWTDAASPEDLRARLEALPGFGEMKVNSLAAVLATALRRRRRGAAGPGPPDARRRRLAAGARRVPGGQARAQGGVARRQGRGLRRVSS